MPQGRRIDPEPQAHDSAPCRAGESILDSLRHFPGRWGGVLGRARDRGLVDLAVWDLREFSSDRHRTIDELPYGGGAGMS